MRSWWGPCGSWDPPSLHRMPGRAMGCFWVQRCPAVHHKYSKLTEPEMELRYSTIYSKLYSPPSSPPPHLPPIPCKKMSCSLRFNSQKGKKNSVKSLTPSGFTQSPLETAAWGRFLLSPCFRCSHLVAQFLSAALVSVLATPGPVLTWNNQSLPSLLPRALLLLGAPHQSPPLRNVS